MKPWGHPDDRQVVPTGSNAVGTRCCASEPTATRSCEVLMSQPCQAGRQAHEALGAPGRPAGRPYRFQCGRDALLRVRANRNKEL
jgi:hypothetical protein